MNSTSMDTTAVPAGPMLANPPLSAPLLRVADQRNHRRYPFAVRIQCRIGRLDAELVDVSLTGLAIKAFSPLRIGMDYSIEIRVAPQPLRFPVIVTRSYLVGFEVHGRDRLPSYRIGLDFRTALDDHAGQILAFLQENIVIHRPRIATSLHFQEDGDAGQPNVCRLVSMSSRELDVVSSRPGTEGGRVAVTMRKGERTVAVEATIASRQPGGSGTWILRLLPGSSETGTRFELRDLIRRELV